MNRISKYIKKQAILLLPITCYLLSAALLTSCSETIDLNPVDESQYALSSENFAFITDEYGESNSDAIVFNEKGSTDFYINLTNTASSVQEFTIVYDADVLAHYNKNNGTSLNALPQNLVTIGSNASVAAGTTKSSAVNVSYTTSTDLDLNGIYAIPLKVIGSGAQASETKGSFILFVQDITKMPDCHKDNGLQVISCMEINDANPLFNLCFTLENSGKYLFDQVILFAGNINYNSETQEVYNYNNENITHILQYKEKYIEPLQQKGMKVVLGILGNHDQSGVASLSTESAKAFALDLKATADAYGLDGIFFDDEYSSYNQTPNPGFVTPSYDAASRLLYECKQAMPDKLVEAYVYGYTTYLNEVDGHQPGEYIDFGIQDYGKYSNLSSNYPGLAKTGMIQASAELNYGSSSKQSTYEKIVTEGYGGTMVFSLAPSRIRMNILNKIAKALYGENVVQNGTIEKDW